METIRYNGKNVYTYSNVQTTERDVRSSKIARESIVDAYFFEVDGDRVVHRVDFDRAKVQKLNVGLMVEVNGKNGGAGTSIAGLDRILSFMVDFGCLGKDLSFLKGKPVTTYTRGMQLVGISS